MPHDPDKFKKVKISKLYEFDGLNKVEVNEAQHRFDRSDFRYCGYSHRRYVMFSGASGTDSFPEDFGADASSMQLHCK